MSNNIYDIINKLNQLEGNKETLTESTKTCGSCGKPMAKCKCEGHKHESKKKNKVKEGAIIEAVNKVEKQLNEKYMGFKKTVAAIKKGGSAENPEAVAASIGRKKYGKEKFQKAAAAGKKLGEDDNYIPDPNDALDQYFDKMYPTDKTSGSSTKSYTRQELPGKSLPPIDNRSRPADKPGKPITKEVEESGLMYHAGVQKHGKKYMDLAKEAGQKGASQEELGRLKDKHSKAYKNKKMDEGSYNEDMLSPKEKSFAALAEPKDKITYADKIAGAKKGTKNEGPEILKIKSDQAKAQGKDEFKVGDKTFPVKEGFPTVSDAEKRMKEREGKTSHGKKTVTSKGVKHERDYDAVDTTPKDRGRPKKDKFAK